MQEADANQIWIFSPAYHQFEYHKTTFDIGISTRTGKETVSFRLRKMLRATRHRVGEIVRHIC